MIKNHKYQNKTVSVTKQILNVFCVKRFMVREDKSYSFGHSLIPSNEKINFISNITTSSNESNVLEFINSSHTDSEN